MSTSQYLVSVNPMLPTAIAGGSGNLLLSSLFCKLVSVRAFLAPRRPPPAGAAKLSAGTQTDSTIKCCQIEKELAERDRQIEVLRGLSKALEAQAKGLKKELEKAREQGTLTAPEAVEKLKKEKDELTKERLQLRSNNGLLAHQVRQAQERTRKLEATVKKANDANARLQERFKLMGANFVRCQEAFQELQKQGLLREKPTTDAPSAKSTTACSLMETIFGRPAQPVEKAEDLFCAECEKLRATVEMLTAEAQEAKGLAEARGAECERLVKEEAKLQAVNESLEERLESLSARLERVKGVGEEKDCRLVELRTENARLNKRCNDKDSRIEVLQAKLARADEKAKAQAKPGPCEKCAVWERKYGLLQAQISLLRGTGEHKVTPDEYNKLFAKERKAAQLMFQQADERKHEAAEFLLSGDKAMGVKCGNEAEFLRQEAQRLDHDAGERLFRELQKRFCNGLRVDLHCLRPDEAVRQVTRILDYFGSAPEILYLELITGQGLHCDGLPPKIKPAIEALLAARKYSFTANNPGCFHVDKALS